MPASYPNHPINRNAEAHAVRQARRTRTLGLLTALASACVCLLLFAGEGALLEAGGTLPRWARTGLLMLALSGPLGLAVLALMVARQQAATAAAAVQFQARRRRVVLTLLDTLPLAVALCSSRDAAALPNRALSALLQLEGSAAQGVRFDWQQFLGPDDAAAWLDARDAVLRSGRSQWLRCSLQLHGAQQPVLLQIAPFAGDDEAEFAVSLTLADGEGGRTQEAVLQLRELLVLAEGEKWHFGQAVHDELGQRLSGIAYFAKALQRRLEQARRTEADDAGWLTHLANESMAVARGLARGLLPVGTDDPGGLGAALAELCDRSAKSFGIDCSLSVDPAFDAGGAARASHLYHAIQELVTNAVKHGGAGKVLVRLERRDDCQRVTVRNDGKPLAASPLRPGMGLRGVRSRAAYLGAHFTFVDDGPGAVLATVELPLAASLPADPADRLPSNADPPAQTAAHNGRQP